MRFGGGIDTGKTTTDICEVRKALPELNIAGSVTPSNPYCHVSSPFSGNTQIKLNGSYPLPHEFFVSALYQNLSGPAYTADWAAPTASIAPSLGRDLSGGEPDGDGRLARDEHLFRSPDDPAGPAGWQERAADAARQGAGQRRPVQRDELRLRAGRHQCLRRDAGSCRRSSWSRESSSSVRS